MNGTKLVTTDEEFDLALSLYEKHKAAFDALITVLARQDDARPEIVAISASLSAVEKMPLELEVDGVTISGKTAPSLYGGVIDFLDQKGLIPEAVPCQSGPKRHVAAFEPTHPNGNAFTTPIPFETSAGRVYVEGNVNRASALKYARALLSGVGFEARLKAAT